MIPALKKGKHSARVKRQYCGRFGKTKIAKTAFSFTVLTAEDK